MQNNIFKCKSLFNFKIFLSKRSPLTMSSEGYGKSSSNLPIIICECGEALLVVPDLLEMVRCIEEHASKHIRFETNPQKAKLEYCRIDELLTQKTLIKVAEGYFDKKNKS
jgi:hypothetical protein